MKITFTSPFHITADNTQFSGKPEDIYKSDWDGGDWCVSWCKGTNKWGDPATRLILIIDGTEKVSFEFWHHKKGFSKGDAEIENRHWLDFFKKETLSTRQTLLNRLYCICREEMASNLFNSSLHLLKIN